MSARTQTNEGVAGSSPVAGSPVRADPASTRSNSPRGARFDEHADIPEENMQPPFHSSSSGWLFAMRDEQGSQRRSGHRFSGLLSRPRSREAGCGAVSIVSRGTGIAGVSSGLPTVLCG